MLAGERLGQQRRRNRDDSSTHDGREPVGSQAGQSISGRIQNIEQTPRAPRRAGGARKDNRSFVHSAIVRCARGGYQSDLDPFVSILETMRVSSAAADPLSSTDLIAVVAAMEAGSVHGAADALGLTASAVSKRLASLERRAGVILFDRGRHGLRSTIAARALYP